VNILKLGQKIPSLHVDNNEYVLEIMCVDEKSYQKLMKAFNGGGTNHGLESALVRYFKSSPSSLSIRTNTGYLSFSYSNYFFEGSIDKDDFGSWRALIKHS